jgi:hypothetical protein
MRGLATIAAMPKRLRVILAAAIAASSLGLAACGDEGTEPSIPPDAAETLLADLEEIQANIDVDSCFAASTRVDDLVNNIQNLPPSVDEELKRNLEASAERLQTLLSEGATDDPACTDDTDTEDETTTEETTTEEPTTTEETTKETTTEEPTTTEETTTTPPTTTTGPPGGSGGIGPG